MNYTIKCNSKKRKEVHTNLWWNVITTKTKNKRESVYSRKEAGHWEADAVVSGQGKSKACFATLAERKTRFYIAVKMPDRRAETMENAISYR